MSKIADVSHLVPPTYEVRLTIPARAALMTAVPIAGRSPGACWVNQIDRPPSATGTPVVTLRTPPRGLVIVIADVLGEQSLAVRLASDGPWPVEYPAAWHDIGAWVPCPTCGAALLWCEAGYVPGWRICLSGHASQLSEDGRSAKRHASQDAATLRSTVRS